MHRYLLHNSTMLFHICILLFFSLCGGQHLVEIYPSYDDHDCLQDCGSRGPLTCYYQLTLDIFYTMQPDCLNCVRYNQGNCSNPQCIPGDGTRRTALVFNNRLPGPTISVCKDDTIVVDVVNVADPQTTTIHWHGISQRGGYIFNDGVPMITQCPILPFTTWRYEFPAAEPGTYFYHSHSASQRADGAYGHLIIREKNPYYTTDFDLPEHSISFLDWFSHESPSNVFQYLRTKEMYTNRFTSILMNGFGGNETNNAPLATFNVRRGFAYRFRLIHAGNIVCPIELTIDNHRMHVIASDGKDFQFETVDTLTMFNGERYDIVIEAYQAVSSYGIRFRGTNICDNIKGLGILHYEGSTRDRNVVFNNQNPTPGRIMNCRNANKTSTCINYPQITGRYAYPYNPDRVDFKYFFGFENQNWVVDRFDGVLAHEELLLPFINEIANRMPETPMVFEQNNPNRCNYENKLNCNGTYCECTHVVRIPANVIVEFIFVDLGTIVELLHPFHIHGYHMYVIGEEKLGDSVTIEEIRDRDARGLLMRNLTRPILKDTVGVPDGGYTIVRFFSDNPGFWALHCHIDFHAEDGMLLVLDVQPYQPPPTNFPRCGSYRGYANK